MDIEYKEKYLKYKIKYLELQDFIKKKKLVISTPIISTKSSFQVDMEKIGFKQSANYIYIKSYLDFTDEELLYIISDIRDIINKKKAYVYELENKLVSEYNFAMSAITDAEQDPLLDINDEEIKIKLKTSIKTMLEKFKSREEGYVYKLESSKKDDTSPFHYTAPSVNRTSGPSRYLTPFGS
uniref:Uncharacterized protein n=1 Tax=viral metagenome TaxID=1070528 RepID=A0A6C0HWV9_9ZZZZ